MLPVRVDYATEDAAGDALVRKIITANNLLVGNCYRTPPQGGFGYLRKTLPSFVKMATVRPFLLLTDLDNATCPVALMSAWCNDHTLNRKELPSSFLFRVAVREAESWFLADHHAVQSMISRKKVSGLPTNPDILDDPKQALLNIVRTNASRSFKDGFLPESGGGAPVGILYNRPHHRTVFRG